MADSASRRLEMTLLGGRFSVCRMVADAQPPPLPVSAALWTVTRAGGETSLVVPAGEEPATADVEGPWRCFRVEGPLAFSLTGILAGLAGILAAAGIPIFALSTWETDYILVREEQATAARRALTAAGHAVGVEPG